ncbi:MAG: sigma-54 dependent transcriptional regulator [Bacteroidota bacterium]
MQKILIIDDDQTVCFSISLLLKRAGFKTNFINHPKGLDRAIGNEKPDLILLDMNFTIETTGKQGLKALELIKRQYPEIPVILMTGWATVQLAVQGMKKGASDFIAKPWDNKQLLSSIRTILDIKKEKADQDLSQLPDFDRILGQDPRLKNVLETAKRVSQTDASVLILGESGTGKELLAEAIHFASQRSDNPFVRVNMGGISSTLFESEMFGHKKGAFTDAYADRKGRFAVANGGSIFLDEIGDLPMPNQVKLLRVLQEKTFEVLGSSTTQKVDVRIISATNKNLEELVAEGSFREDLFYRINLIQLELPPLRQRPGDIPILVNQFLSQIEKNYQKSGVTINESAINWLQRQQFPGNIRQLKNLIERAVLMAPKTLLELEDVRIHYQEYDKAKSDLPEVGTISLEEMEKQMILKTLAFHGKNISLTAKSLGLTRSSLYRRLQKFDIPYDN